MKNRSIWAAVLGTAAIMTAQYASAQEFVLEGYYDCARATNGRTYCRQRGNKNYVPISEEFFARYQAIRGGAPVGGNVVTNKEVTVQNTTVNVVVQNLGLEYADLDGQEAILTSLIAEQQALRQSGKEPVDAIDRTVTAIEARLVELRRGKTEKIREASKYQTSIRPNDFDQYISSRKLSEIYPKVPYYVPGTKETGEFWIEPEVKEDGSLVFRFRFIDPHARNERTRSMIEMRPDELERTRRALLKLQDWSATAHEKKLRRAYSKRVDCFPVESCPAEGEKLEGRSSTEIVFTVTEDGATGGRFQRNKGRFEESYGVSIESALMLQAYLRHVLREGRREYEAGSQSKEDLDRLFN
jgi:hypothetical protein